MTPWTVALQASLFFSRSYSLLRLSLPTISSSVALFSCLQSFPASRSFPMCRIKWPKYWSFGFSNPESESEVSQSCRTLSDPRDCSLPGSSIHGIFQVRVWEWPGLPVHHQVLEFTQTHVHQVGDAIQPSHPLSSPPPAPNPSQHQSSSESTLHMRWPEYWSFSFSISPSNEYPGLIFRMDWLDHLASTEFH